MLARELGPYGKASNFEVRALIENLRERVGPERSLQEIHDLPVFGLDVCYSEASSSVSCEIT